MKNNYDPVFDHTFFFDAENGMPQNGLISHHVLIEWFLQIEFTHKPVNLISYQEIVGCS